MNYYSPPLALETRDESRVDVTPHPGLRVAQALASAVFAVGAWASGDPLWLAGTALCLLAALSEDRWILDARVRRVSRRFGILPMLRSFELDWDEIEAVFLETVERPPPEDPESKSDDVRSLYTRLMGKGSRGWAAWGFFLSSGRAITVRADSLKRRTAVRALAEGVSKFLGKELRDL